MDERFLVTGSGGCIGAWAVAQLVGEGTAVVAFDASDDDHRLRLLLDGEELAALDARARRHHRPRRARAGARRARRSRTSIHLAALQVPFCRADPPLGARVNVVGTVNVFEAVARRARPDRRPGRLRLLGRGLRRARRGRGPHRRWRASRARSTASTSARTRGRRRSTRPSAGVRERRAAAAHGLRARPRPGPHVRADGGDARTPRRGGRTRLPFGGALPAAVRAGRRGRVRRGRARSEGAAGAVLRGPRRAVRRARTSVIAAIEAAVPGAAIDLRARRAPVPVGRPATPTRWPTPLDATASPTPIARVPRAARSSAGLRRRSSRMTEPIQDRSPVPLADCGPLRYSVLTKGKRTPVRSPRPDHREHHDHEHRHQQRLPAATWGVDPVHSTAGFAIKYMVSTFRRPSSPSSTPRSTPRATTPQLTGSVDPGLDPGQGRELPRPPAVRPTSSTPSATRRSPSSRPPSASTATSSSSTATLTIKGETRPVEARGTLDGAVRGPVRRHARRRPARGRRRPHALRPRAGTTRCPRAASRWPTTSASSSTSSSSRRSAMKVLGISGSLRRGLPQRRSSSGRRPRCCRPGPSSSCGRASRPCRPTTRTTSALAAAAASVRALDDGDRATPTPCCSPRRSTTTRSRASSRTRSTGSRARWPKSPLRSKPVAVVGASTGLFGAVWAQAEVRKVLGAIGARVVDRELPVGQAADAFTDDGRLADERPRARPRRPPRRAHRPASSSPGSP